MSQRSRPVRGKQAKEVCGFARQVENIRLPFIMADKDRIRFEAKQDRTGDCWNWTAATGAGGYGVFKVGRRTMTAHRLALKLATEVDMPNLQAAHSCGNVLCCNPAHLRWATHQENQDDKRRTRAEIEALDPERSNRVPRLFAWNIPAQRMAQ